MHAHAGVPRLRRPRLRAAVRRRRRGADDADGLTGRDCRPGPVGVLGVARRRRAVVDQRAHRLRRRRRRRRRAPSRPRPRWSGSGRRTAATFYAAQLRRHPGEAAAGLPLGQRLALLLAAVVLLAPARSRGWSCRSRSSATASRSSRSGRSCCIILGAPDSGSPSGTAIFLAALCVLLHHRRRRRCSGSRPPTGPASTWSRVYGGGRLHPAAQGAADRGPARASSPRCRSPSRRRSSARSSASTSARSTSASGPAMINAQQSLNAAAGLGHRAGLAARSRSPATRSSGCSPGWSRRGRAGSRA